MFSLYLKYSGVVELGVISIESVHNRNACIFLNPFYGGVCVCVCDHPVDLDLFSSSLIMRITSSLRVATL